MLTRRNDLLRRLPTAGLTTELVIAELEHAEATLIATAERLAEETQRGALPSEASLRECAAAGLWVVRWQDVLDRLRDLEKRTGRPTV